MACFVFAAIAPAVLGLDVENVGGGAHLEVGGGLSLGERLRGDREGRGPIISGVVRE